MPLINILPQLRAAGLDDHECLLVLQDAFPDTSTLHRGTEMLVNSSSGIVATVVTASKRRNLTRIEVDTTSGTTIIEAITRATEAIPPKVAGTVVLSNLKLVGYATVPGWLQIRPISVNDVRDMTASQILIKRAIDSGNYIPFPISLEVIYQASKNGLIDGYRMMSALLEAKYLLAAFLETPIHQTVQAYSYARIDNDIALISGTAPHLAEQPTDRFSDVSDLQEIQTTDLALIQAQLGLHQSELRVPDLQSLWNAYSLLSKTHKLMFQRAGANLWDASNPTISSGGRIVASVFAIEALLARKPRNQINAKFKKFVDDYVRPDASLRALYHAVYDSRSDLAHGRWHIGVDEPMFGFRDSYQASLLAWSAAKRGAVNWLLTKSAAAQA